MSYIRGWVSLGDVSHSSILGNYFEVCFFILDVIDHDLTVWPLSSPHFSGGGISSGIFQGTHAISSSAPFNHTQQVSNSTSTFLTAKTSVEVIINISLQSLPSFLGWKCTYFDVTDRLLRCHRLCVDRSFQRTQITPRVSTLRITTHITTTAPT